MKAVRLLLLMVIGACHSPKPIAPDSRELYNEFLRVDSLVRLKPDSAFFFYNKAVNKTTDSSYKGTWLQRMATIQQREGDFLGSTETALASLKLFDEKDSAHYPNISYNYNLMASNCLELARYDDALTYYDLALKYSPPTYIPVYTTNKGVAHVRKKQYEQAIALYETVLKKPIEDSQVYARTRFNLAKARWLRDPGYPALAEFHEATQIRKLINDQWGLNSSYSHLADYFTATNPDSARFYAAKMYEVAIGLKSAADQADALEKLVRLSSGAAMKDYFTRYDLLTDSIQLARANAKNQFADIRFAAEEARADNLLLEKDNTQKRSRITRQRVIIYSTIVLFTTLAVLGLFWYRKRKRFQELQTKNAIRESELKTSQKVHDVVANGLYRIMTDIEHGDTIQKEQLLDKIETLYEQSRDLSYEQAATSFGNFSETLTGVLMSFATPTTRVLIVGNNENLWNHILPAVKKELEYVLQELMINMAKHSKAQNVVISFERQSGQVKIRYKDDGVGQPADFRYGNGLTNTGNRINGIGGRISFDWKTGKGLQVDISFPTTKAG